MDGTSGQARLGELIAYHRRRRGVSQAVFAGLLGRSESWVSQVERGARKIDRVSVLLDVARVLRVPPSALLPDSFALEPDAPAPPEFYRLRLALAGHEVLRVLGDPGAPEAADLEEGAASAAVSQAWDLLHASRYVELADMLPDLLTGLDLSARQHRASAARRMFALSAQAYQVAAALLAKLGETDAAWIAAERSVGAAERARDELLACAGEFRLAHVFLQAGRLAEGQRAVSVALTSLHQRPEAHLDPARVALRGALSLVDALIAVQQGEAERALSALAHARSQADVVGEGRNDFHTEFGPTNVSLHEVAVYVELGDAGRAIRTAKTVDASALSAERQARFLIDVGRAHTQRRNAAGAVEAFEAAERLTPEQVQTNARVRECVKELLRGEPRSPNPALRALARRLGLLR